MLLNSFLIANHYLFDIGYFSIKGSFQNRHYCNVNNVFELCYGIKVTFVITIGSSLWFEWFLVMGCFSSGRWNICDLVMLPQVNPTTPPQTMVANTHGFIPNASPNWSPSLLFFLSKHLEGKKLCITCRGISWFHCVFKTSCVFTHCVMRI